MINHWTAQIDTVFAEWEAVFTPPTTAADLETLLRFASALLAAGAREEVYQVAETRSPLAFRREAGQTFAEFLAGTLAETGGLPLFDLGLGVASTGADRLITPACLCYFDRSGARVEAEVADVGALLAELRPAEAAWADGFMDHVSPVTVLGRTIRLPRPDELGARSRPSRITISLRTDIWFPRVLGLLEGDQPLRPDPPKWYDNRDLAECHTPRLNRFLADVRRATLDLGGRWNLLAAPEGIGVRYAPMVRDGAIVLEA